MNIHGIKTQQIYPLRAYPALCPVDRHYLLKGRYLRALRTGVGYFLIPIQTGVNRVGTGLYNELTDISRLKTALDENDRLKIQVDRLTEENNRLQAQQFELNRLRSYMSWIRNTCSIIKSAPG